MAYLLRGIKSRIQRIRCASYRGTCSFCTEWKAARLKAATGCPDDCPVCTGTVGTTR